MRLVEQFTSVTNTRDLLEHFKQTFIDSNPPRLVCTAPHSYTDSTNLAVGVMLTLLHTKETRFKIKFRNVSSTHYSMNNLNPNGIFEDLNEKASRIGLDESEEYVFKKMTGMSLSLFSKKEDSYSVIMVEAPKGITNVQRWLTHYGYENIQTTIAEPDTSHKVLVYKIKNTLLIISNTIPNAYNFYTRLTGWLPLLFKDLYKDILVKGTPMYDFFNKCYTNEPYNYNIISDMDVLKNLKTSIKLTNITKTIDTIEDNLKEYDIENLKHLQNNLKAYEEEYATLLKKINVAEMRIATASEIANKELILQQLARNPNFDKMWTLPNTIILRAKGPVDYDKTKIKSILKSSGDFQKIMTADFLELHWESCCLLNYEDYTVRNASDYYSGAFIPNTHWNSYSCFGNNVPPLQKALKEKDFLSVFMVALTAAQLLNVYDITVLNKLKELLYYSYPDKKTFLNKNTNEFVSYIEAVNLIKGV